VWWDGQLFFYCVLLHSIGLQTNLRFTRLITGSANISGWSVVPGLWFAVKIFINRFIFLWSSCLENIFFNTFPTMNAISSQVPLVLLAGIYLILKSCVKDENVRLCNYLLKTLQNCLVLLWKYVDSCHFDLDGVFSSFTQENDKIT
jgi:hypothetical protein